MEISLLTEDLLASQRSREVLRAKNVLNTRIYHGGIHQILSGRVIFGFSYKGMKIGDEFIIYFGMFKIKQKVTNTVLQPFLNGIDPYYIYFARYTSTEITFDSHVNNESVRIYGTENIPSFVDQKDKKSDTKTDEWMLYHNIQGSIYTYKNGEFQPIIICAHSNHACSNNYDKIIVQENVVRKAYINNRRKRGNLQFVNFY